MGERPFSYDICENSFSSASQLKIHKRSPTGEKPLCCDACEKASFFASHLKVQKRKFHTGEKPFSCSVCGNTFSQERYVKKHERIHPVVK